MHGRSALKSLAWPAVCLALVAAAQGQQPPAQTPAAGQNPTAQQPGRIITQVRGDLYRVEDRTGFSVVTVFLVTPEGIVLTDPLNPEFAAWLKGELATRFPGRPVRYVLQTHYHWDHARGGGMFADTARFIGHANMIANMSAPIRQARPPGETDDLDGDDRLTRQEALTGTRARFDQLDGNGDGFLTQAEMMADVRRPDITFSDRHTLTLGGKRVELIYAGNRHSNDLYDVYFPDERVLFSQDYTQIRQICCNFAYDRKPAAAWIESLRTLERLDFDVLIPSHGPAGTKSDLVAQRAQMEELTAAVAAGIRAGQTLEQMQKSIRLEKYKDWAGYDRLPATIESTYRSLTQYSPAASGSAATPSR